MERSLLRWDRSSHDQCAAFSVLTVAALLVAVALAVFGLPNVDAHGPLHQFGLMDPLCGGTRALRYAARGEWSQSWTYNPLGATALVIAVVGVARLLLGAGTGMWVAVSVSWTLRRKRFVVVAVAVLLVALEVRQQSLAALLTQAG